MLCLDGDSMHVPSLCSSGFLSSGPGVGPFPEIHIGLHRHGLQCMRSCTEGFITVEWSTAYFFFFLLRIQATLIASTEIRFSRSGSFLLKRDDFFPGQLIAGLPIPFKKHCPIPIARTAYRSVVWLWLLQFLTWCTDIITFLKVWVSHSVLSLHTWDDLSLHWFT